MTDIFRPAYYVKTWWPELLPPDNSLRTWTLNLLQTTLNPPDRRNVQRSPLYIKTHWPEYWTPENITWEWKYIPELIGKDRLPTGKQVTDLPPVGKYIRQVDLNTWTDWYNLELIGKDKRNPGQQSFDLTPRMLASITWYRSWELNLLQNTLRPAAALPPGVMPGNPEYDLPPRSPFDPYIRTWTWSYNLNLIGQDRFLPGQQFESLPPAGPQRQADLGTWTWRYPLELIGKDQLPPGENVFDLPPRPPFEPATRTWTFSYNLNLIGADVLPAGKNVYDRPVLLPVDLTRSTWVYNLLENTLSTIPPPGVAVFDRPGVPPWYRSWEFNLVEAELEPLPPGAAITDRPAVPSFYRDWLQNLLENTLAPIGTPVGLQVFERPPVGPQQPAQSFTAFYNVNLIGQDQLPTGKQDSARPPLAPIPPENIKSWIQSTNIALLTQPQPPFLPLDFPNPRAPLPSAQSFVNFYLQTLIGQDQLPPGKQVYDLAPRPYPTTDYRSWIAFTSLALNGSLGVPIGAQVYDLTPFAPRPGDLRTWIDRTKLLLLVPFNQTDWPLPGQPQVPQRTWINQLPVDLVSALIPFNQTDWPPPRGPLLPQRTFTFSFPLELIGQDQLPPGRQTSDLAPIGYPYPSFQRSVTVSPAVPPIVVTPSGGETLLMMGMG